jgi:hypothetical protein
MSARTTSPTHALRRAAHGLALGLALLLGAAATAAADSPLAPTNAAYGHGPFGTYRYGYDRSCHRFFYPPRYGRGYARSPYSPFSRGPVLPHYQIRKALRHQGFFHVRGLFFDRGLYVARVSSPSGDSYKLYVDASNGYVLCYHPLRG